MPRTGLLPPPSETTCSASHLLPFRIRSPWGAGGASTATAVERSCSHEFHRVLVLLRSVVSGHSCLQNGATGRFRRNGAQCIGLEVLGARSLSGCWAWRRTGEGCCAGPEWRSTAAKAPSSMLKHGKQLLGGTGGCVTNDALAIRSLHPRAGVRPILVSQELQTVRGGKHLGWLWYRRNKRSTSSISIFSKKIYPSFLVFHPVQVPKALRPTV